MGHLFLSMATQEGRGAFKTVVTAPGAHLLIKKRRIEFKIHLFIEFVNHVSVFSIVALRN